MGFVGIGDNVEFCISGLDRWYGLQRPLPHAAPRRSLIRPVRAMLPPPAAHLLARRAGMLLIAGCEPSVRNRAAWPSLPRQLQVPIGTRLRLLRARAVLVAELLRGRGRGRQPAAMQGGTALRLHRAWAVAAIRARLPEDCPTERAEGLQRDAADALRSDAVGRPDPPRMELARRLLRPVAEPTISPCCAWRARRSRSPSSSAVSTTT